MAVLTRLTSSVHGHKKLNTGGKGLHWQVGICQLLFVTFVLMIPQLTLQILNIFIPTHENGSTNLLRLSSWAVY
jgi:hypothetical protein